MKFCKDCNLFDSWEEACTHPAAVSTDLVTGGVSSYSAKYYRASELLCGTEAKWFEPKKSFFDRFRKQKIDLSGPSN